MRVTETTRVVCPSGLIGEVRALKVAEILAMQDPKSLRQGKVFNQLVASCWQTTIDPGPYHFDASQPPPWSHMLHCDKMVALRDIRALTGGSDYEFEMKCSHCEHRYVWVQPLHELKSKPLPQDTIERVRQRQNFFVDISGDRVEFRQLINADDEQLVRLTRDGASPTTAGFICRIVQVTAQNGAVFSDAQEIGTWLSELDPISFDELETALDDTDGGLELRTEVECPSCAQTETVIVPLFQSISRSSIRRSNQIAKAKMEQSAAGGNTTMKTPTQNPPMANSGAT